MTPWFTLALLLAGSVQAQTVWRCGPDGNTYSSSACAEGRAVVVADARNPAEVQAARADGGAVTFRTERAVASGEELTHNCSSTAGAPGDVFVCGCGAAGVG